jgi:hypothetical protein
VGGIDDQGRFHASGRLLMIACFLYYGIFNIFFRLSP